MFTLLYYTKVNLTMMNTNYYVNPNHQLFQPNHILNNNFVTQLRESAYMKSLTDSAFNRGFLYGLCTGAGILLLWLGMIVNISSTPDL